MRTVRLCEMSRMLRWIALRRFQIEGAGCLVEDRDPGSGHQGTRDGDALALASEIWIKERNAALTPFLPRIESEYREVKQRLWPSIDS